MGLGIFVELRHVVRDPGGLLHVKRFVVGQERARRGDIGLGLFVRSPVNCIIGTLEQQCFAVEHQFNAGILIFRVEAAQALARQDDGNRDVIFYLHFVRGMKIRAEFVNAPGTLAVVTNAQVIVHKLLILEFEFVSQEPVHPVNSEMFAPVVAPFGPVIALHGEQ